MLIRRSRIFVRDLVLPVSMGIHDFERAAPQRVVINVEIELAGPATDPGDDIANVLNYDRVTERIRALVKDRHFNLQETLCRDIAASLADLPGIARMRLSTAKPDVYADCAAVGYELEVEVEGTDAAPSPTAG